MLLRSLSEIERPVPGSSKDYAPQSDLLALFVKNVPAIGWMGALEKPYMLLKGSPIVKAQE